MQDKQLKMCRTVTRKTRRITDRLACEEQPRTTELEELVFLMFKDASTDDYKRFIIYIVHSTISSNPNITLSNLIFILERKMFLSSSDILSAVSVLQNPEVFNAISSWSNTKTTHLRTKDSDVYSNWVSSTVQSRPHMSRLSSPVLHKNKQHGNV